MTAACMEYFATGTVGALGFVSCVRFFFGIVSDSR